MSKKKDASDFQIPDKPTSTDRSGRRSFLRQSAGTGLLGALASMTPKTAQAQDAGGDDYRVPRDPRSARRGASSSARGRDPGLGYDAGDGNEGVHAPLTSEDRATHDFERRVKISRGYLNQAIQQEPQAKNNDERAYRQQRYYASFTKTLPSNEYCEVDPQAFETLISALDTQSPVLFDAVPRDPMAQYRLANPQGALKFQSCGLDGHASRIAASHRMASAELAGEMVEVYWQALTRDIPFEDYPAHNTISAAVRDLNRLSVTPGEASNGSISAFTLFRGETQGDRTGPYISQFLWKDFKYGPLHVKQRYEVPERGQDFMTSVEDWRNIQKGALPTRAPELRRKPRYIYNGRSLAEFVHQDVSFQAYLNAALILLSYGPSALATSAPYGTLPRSADGFVSHGAPFILDLVSRAAQASLHAAWYQKWSVHRFLRPEALGGRVHFHLTEKRDYAIHSDLLNSQALNRAFRRQGTYLLSQAYPEGSPTHPSYPAGHACIAGACVTVLKALFNESFAIPDPVVATNKGRELARYRDSDLFVGDELNKLANNMSLGRDTAGVHYRQDGIQGLLAGEQVAISLLREASTNSLESDFQGYGFTDFQGKKVQIQSGIVIA